LPDLEQWVLEGAELLQRASSDPGEAHVIDKLVKSETHGICHDLIDEDLGDEVYREIAHGVGKMVSMAVRLHQTMLSSRGFFHVSMPGGLDQSVRQKMDEVHGLKHDRPGVKM
jgi:hypothetical protein